MCEACGCNDNMIGKTGDQLSGKPQDPYGQYDGVGGSK